MWLSLASFLISFPRSPLPHGHVTTAVRGPLDVRRTRMKPPDGYIRNPASVRHSTVDVLYTRLIMLGSFDAPRAYMYTTWLPRKPSQNRRSVRLSNYEVASSEPHRTSRSPILSVVVSATMLLLLVRRCWRKTRMRNGRWRHARRENSLRYLQHTYTLVGLTKIRKKRKKRLTRKEKNDGREGGRGGAGGNGVELKLETRQFFFAPFFLLLLNARERKLQGSGAIEKPRYLLTEKNSLVWCVFIMHGNMCTRWKRGKYIYIYIYIYILRENSDGK